MGILFSALCAALISNNILTSPGGLRRGGVFTVWGLIIALEALFEIQTAKRFLLFAN